MRHFVSVHRPNGRKVVESQKALACRATKAKKWTSEDDGAIEKCIEYLPAMPVAGKVLSR